MEGEVLVCVRDASNTEDPYAVAVISDANEIEHVTRIAVHLFCEKEEALLVLFREVSTILVIYRKDMPYVFKFSGDSNIR